MIQLEEFKYQYPIPSSGLIQEVEKQTEELLSDYEKKNVSLSNLLEKLPTDLSYRQLVHKNNLTIESTLAPYMIPGVRVLNVVPYLFLMDQKKKYQPLFFFILSTRGRNLK